MAGKSYQWSPSGIRGIGGSPDPEPELDATVDPPQAPKRAGPARPATGLTPKNIVAMAKRRQREVNRELKNARALVRRLEREKLQIDGLVGAASKPLAIVHQLKSGTK